MVLQPVRLAAVVRVRGVVCGRGCREAQAVERRAGGPGRSLDDAAIRVSGGDDLARPAMGPFHTEVARPNHVSDRQVEPPHFTPGPLSGARRDHDPVRAERLVAAAAAGPATAHSVRTAFAGTVLLWRMPVVCQPR